ncbi:MAG: deiodinase-like protein [Flavobacteriales bacterium]
MRQFLLSLTFLFSFQGYTQLNNWDPSWYPSDSALVFHDDLDFYLNAYTKKEIKKMRKQVNMWRMNFDKMMRTTIREIRSYSEGGGMVPQTHDFSLPEVISGGNYSLSGKSGRIRAFMFGSITSPPARVQMERWSALAKKYDNEDVDIFVIYGREMHPSDKGNFKKFPIPTTLEQKTQYAAQFSQLGELPVLVDGMDDATFNNYGRAPNGAYLVDKDGNLVFRSTWADARKIEHMIDTLLKWYKAGKPKNFIAK